MPKKEEIVEIVNIVASASLNQRMNLNAIVKLFPNVEYRPDTFPGLVFRLKRPKTATLIFNSGKMVCTGSRSEAMARQAVRQVVRRLKEGGIAITGKPEIEIQNIVASVSLGGAVNLERIGFILRRVMYEPEQFPGLVYRMNDPKVVILIFSTGKLVITGAKREEEVYQATVKLREQLEADDLISYDER